MGNGTKQQQHSDGETSVMCAGEGATSGKTEPVSMRTQLAHTTHAPSSFAWLCLTCVCSLLPLRWQHEAHEPMTTPATSTAECTAGGVPHAVQVTLRWLLRSPACTSFCLLRCVLYVCPSLRALFAFLTQPKRPTANGPGNRTKRRAHTQHSDTGATRMDRLCSPGSTDIGCRCPASPRGPL